ncbi:hypothetical protein BpV1_033 [Bathycoccus sp. RCC1105 virus BpV1]|uniref:hypothetical protein n=1 Tax=Bathycoccus sp. RCC1105 virus BpV1 TaxID=880159 RepID=UPI0001EF43A6|nr:hypothetical protein BpV1_033 [Bathycoccus sp. RCC1105 virus BpV1]ADQ91660.1 hypothetical protein BpV1_033 [Bathycoccus sp. RCC1105 virus BpV1]
MKAVMAAKKAAQKAKALKARGAAVAAKGAVAADKARALAQKGQAFAEQAQTKGQALADKGQAALDKGKAVAAQGQAVLLPPTKEVLNIPAPVQPRINQVPQPILSQPVIKSEPTINMSEATVVRDPELVSVVNKLKAGKIETEIGYPQVGLTILLGIFFVAVTALGIDKYNKCEGIQDSEKYQNLKMFMSHTMAIAITIPVILLLQKFVSNEGGVFTIIYAIMGLTASAIAMDIMRQPECEDTVKKSDKNFAIMSLVGWIILLLAGCFFTFKKHPKLGEVLRKKTV